MEKSEVKSEPVNITGIWVYDRLPEGMRPGTVNDLVGPSGPVVGTWFLIQSFENPSHFSAYLVKPNFNLSKWLPWLDAGRLYVKS